MHRIEKMQFDNMGINVYYYKGEEYISRKAVINKMMYENALKSSPEDHTYKIVLECSTCGDKRFSAFGAKVNAFGKKDTIEFHYQLVKGFNDMETMSIDEPWHAKNEFVQKKLKGKQHDFTLINDKKYNCQIIHQWYHLLWIKYLDQNPGLVEYLKLFDDYNDVFKGKSLSCQADSIRKYIKDGRESLMGECEELLRLLKG